MKESLYHYSFEVTRVYDGDTIHGIADMGFNTFKKISVRLEGINTPEIRTKDLDEKARGYAARDFLREIIKEADAVYIKTTEKGKYGRWVGLVYIDHPELGDGYEINALMVSSGHAIFKQY